MWFRQQQKIPPVVVKDHTFTVLNPSLREAIMEEKQLICGHLPVGGGGGGLTNSVPFGVIFRSSTGTIFFIEILTKVVFDE